jgi:hypothetical protein
VDSELGIGGIIALLLLLFSGKKKKDEIVPVNIIPEGLPDTNVPSRTDDGAEPPPKEDDKGPPLPEIVDTYPRPASFYPVKGGDYGYGIAFRFLRSAGYLAAKEYGKADDATANAFGQAVASSVSRQKQVWRAISCNGWNDALYTTYGWAGKSQPLAPTGRVVRLVQQHADNRARLSNKEPPIRNMRFKTVKDKGKGNGYGVTASMRNYEFLWLPGVQLKTLWESDGASLVFGGEWKNGATQKLPPPWVLKLGVVNEPGITAPTSNFGCDASQWSPKA